MRIRTICSGLAALGLIAAAPASATFPGSNGRLVVERGAGQQVDLYTLAPDGSGEDRVLGSARIEEDPSWSADGRRLAFALSAPRGEPTEIVTVDPSGGDRKRVTRFASVARGPAWNPGGRLAFWTFKDFEDFDGLPPAEIYSIRENGRGVRRLTDDLQVQVDPTYSPDGRRMAYVEWREVKGQPGVHDNAIYVARADGSHARALTRFSAKRDTINPSWSPDGKKIAFEIASRQPPNAFDKSRQSDLAVIRADGTGERRLTRTPTTESYPVWSPDGRTIAFTSDRHRRRTRPDPFGRHMEVYVMAADGSGVRRITRNKVADADPDWQPLPAR